MELPRSLWWGALAVAYFVLPLSQAGRSASVSPESPEPPAQNAGKAAEPEPQTAKESPEKLLLDDLLGVDAKSASPLEGFVRQARTAGFEVPERRLLIALVPDPKDSSVAEEFDQAISAIEEAYAEDGYVLDRFVLPWVGKPGSAPEYRQTPGVLIFRQAKLRRLGAVLLVGEVPFLGVHRKALAAAVSVFRHWQADSSRPAPVLGPSFSGSADSILTSLRLDHIGPLHFVSGSAKSPSLPGKLGARGSSFESAVLDWRELQKSALEYFTEDLGLDPNRIALLVEPESVGELSGEVREYCLQLPFPPGIAGLRSAWENDAKRSEGRPDAGAKGGSGAALPRLTLDLNLGETESPVQVPPNLSPVTAPARDLAIARLLTEIAERRIDAIGIQATDPRDALFLAERIRRYAPSKALFLVDHDLIVAHPRFSAMLNGTLLLSAFPLYPHPDPVATPRGNALRQFTSDFHEGIYRATRHLIAGAPLSPGPLWISAVGNGVAWPLAQLTDGHRIDPVDPASDSCHAGAKLLSCALGLFLFAFALEKFGRIPESASWVRWLPALLAASVLLTLSALLADLGWRLQVLYEPRMGPWHLSTIAAIPLLMTFWKISRFLANDRNRILVFSFILAFTAALTWPIHLAVTRIWAHGAPGLFLPRAFYFSSGLSPLVSLGWLACATFLWAFNQIRRHAMQARQRIEWPAAGERAPAIIQVCRDRAEEVTAFLHWTQPRGRGARKGMPRRWILQLFGPIWIAVPFGVLMARFTVVSIAEHHLYGRLFVGLLGFVLALGAFSFCRFVGAWRLLTRMLDRLSLPSLPKVFDAELAEAVRWNPMKSFGLGIPRFSTAVCLVEHLKALAGTGVVSPGLADRAQTELDAAIDASMSDDPEAEVASRRELRGTLEEALTIDPPGGGLDRLGALWLVIFIRYVFAHLRGWLVGALTCGAALLIAAGTYAFEPNELVANSLAAAFLAALLLTLAVFVQMERNPVLSAIAGTKAGQVNISRQLVFSTLTYFVLPMLGLIASRFPAVGRFIGELSNPLLKMVGGG